MIGCHDSRWGDSHDRRILRSRLTSSPDPGARRRPAQGADDHCQRYRLSRLWHRQADRGPAGEAPGCLAYRGQPRNTAADARRGTRGRTGTPGDACRADPGRRLRPGGRAHQDRPGHTRRTGKTHRRDRRRDLAAGKAAPRRLRARQRLASRLPRQPHVRAHGAELQPGDGDGRRDRHRRGCGDRPRWHYPAGLGPDARDPRGSPTGAPRMTTSAKETIARRVAKEVRPGSLVNLGIGLPTLVDAYMPPGVTAFFLTENGLIGIGAPPPPGMENPDLIDAGNEYVTAVPGASSLDSTVTFGLIRGGHLDLAVLGGLQVDKHGRLANWMIPGKLVPGMGGAMDLVSGARRIIIAMIHTAKGASKFVEECTIPLTSIRPVSLVVTEMAVIEPTAEGLVLRERAPGVSVADVIGATAAKLIIPPTVPEYVLS